MEQSRRLRKKDKTHRELMHSAKLLFERNGIGNVTIEQISEGADVSRSTFFSHFSSLDDLITQIADEEINDILSVGDGEGKPDVSAVFRKLSDDTYPYPYLTTELFVRSIVSPGKSSISNIDALIRSEIHDDGFEGIKQCFSEKDISAFIMGAYFGLVFQKFINGEAFENPDETNDKIQKYINYIKENGGKQK